MFIRVHPWLSSYVMDTMKHELDIYMRARYPLLWVVTPEEERALAEIQALADAQHKRLMTWSITQGVVNPARPEHADAGKRDGADFAQVKAIAQGALDEPTPDRSELIELVERAAGLWPAE